MEPIVYRLLGGGALTFLIKHVYTSCDTSKRKDYAAMDNAGRTGPLAADLLLVIMLRG